MKKRKFKIFKRICLIIALIFVVLFAANWYLKHRLESYLRDMLSQKISEATDGVYKFEFTDLSIGFISGELLIEGIDLRPDSIYLQDSTANHKQLDQYVELHIGSIYFKGVNLVWKYNYKKLKFNLFEIKDADINIYNKELAEKKPDNDSISNLDLYQVISPYINVLSVKKIRLQNSTVNYRFSDKEGFVSRYALHDINFEANDFLLDENSESSGKLLYSDNFNFQVNKPQRLVSNGQFSLLTDKMIFDTKDSIIQIKNVQLIPKRKFWKRVNQLPDSYVEGKIDSINVHGLYFTRSQGSSALAASKFDINYPQIEYFVTDKDSLSKLSANSTNTDTLDLSWSLYSIIAPILNKVSIDAISINDAKFKYKESFRQDTNTYTLDKVNLIALNFRVDSLSELNTEKRFLYSDGFGLKAEGLKGIDIQKNHIISADYMTLNTLERFFQIEHISLDPINTKTKNDYVKGSVDVISIRDLDYNNGLDASSLVIKNPVLEYVKLASVKEYENKLNEIQTIKDGTNIWQQITPFFNHLFVKEIVIEGGVLHFTDKVLKNKYSLSDLYLNASDLLINQNTINSSAYMSAFGNLDFTYGKFEGIWVTLNQKIESQRTVFSKKNKNFRIENLRITPLLTSGKNIPKVPTLMNMYFPLIDFRGLVFDFRGFYLKNLKINTLNIASPQVFITRFSDTKVSQTEKKTEVSSGQLREFIERIDLTKLNLSDVNIKYISNLNKDTLSNKIKKMELENLSWKVDEDLNLGRVFLDGSNMSIIENDIIRKKGSEKKNTTKSSIFKGINIIRLDISNSNIFARNPHKTMDVRIPYLGFSNLHWNQNVFDMNDINIENSDIKLVEASSDNDTLKDTIKSTNTTNNNIYKKLRGISDQINIRSINISNANMNYSFLTENAPQRDHNISKANFRLQGLHINNIKEKYGIDNINLNIKDFHYPSSNGFYSYKVKEIDYNNISNRLNLDSVALVPAYPKMEFAYKNPHHADWFDVRVGQIELSGINLPKLISDNTFFADTLVVNNVLLQNFKNQNIEIKHNIMPMIYEGLQDLPLKLSIKRANVYNFNVVYEELSKKGTIPSKIVFSNMNGRLKGLTNIVTTPNQFIDLSADGIFMETGNFAARWLIPVSSNYDCFELDANMKNFKLTDLNPIIEPMAPVTIADGLVKDVTFSIEGSSIGAQVKMLMLYNDLNVTIQKGINNENKNSLLTTITNKILKKNNPKKPNSKPRQPDLYVTRDPYHSTFNYLWQILQPPLVESVGISQKKQNFIRKVTGVISSVKNLFKRDKNKDKDEEK